MNDHQLELLARLVQSLDGDPVAQADLNSYGKAYNHLPDYLADQRIEQLTLTAKELYPA